MEEFPPALRLPSELILCVAALLRGVDDVARMGATCALFRDAIMHDALLWRDLYARKAEADTRDLAHAWLSANHPLGAGADFWRWLLRARCVPLASPSGIGWTTYEDKRVAGDWTDGVRHGWCYELSPEDNERFAHVFVGQFASGEVCGIGKIVHSSGKVYEGGWRGDRYHGLGALTRNPVRTASMFSALLASLGGERWISPYTVEGEFRHGRPLGRCVARFASGVAYIGKLRDNGAPIRSGLLIVPPSESLSPDDLVACHVAWTDSSRFTTTTVHRDGGMLLAAGGGVRSFPSPDRAFAYPCGDASTVEVMQSHGNGDVTFVRRIEGASSRSADGLMVDAIAFVCSPLCPDAAFAGKAFVGLRWDVDVERGTYLPSAAHPRERDEFIAYVRRGHIHWDVSTVQSFLLANDVGVGVLVR